MSPDPFLARGLGLGDKTLSSREGWGWGTRPFPRERAGVRGQDEEEARPPKGCGQRMRN